MDERGDAFLTVEDLEAELREFFQTGKFEGIAPLWATIVQLDQLPSVIDRMSQSCQFS